MYYHVVSDLETLFPGLEQVPGIKRLVPKIPRDRMWNEDCTTARVLAGRTVEDCVTSLGVLGRFRRCLAANDGAKSYAETGNEVYPVLVLALDPEAPFFEPDESLVPDVKRTHELWCTQPVDVLSCELKWLSPYSVIVDEDDEELCVKVRFVPDAKARKREHPWLNGKGHPLESSQMDYEPWEGNARGLSESAKAYVKYERRTLRRPVMAMPVDNAYAVCYPVDTVTGTVLSAAEPVRVALADLRDFTGFETAKGQYVFVDDEIRLDDGMYRVIAHDRRYFLESYAPKPDGGGRKVLLLEQLPTRRGLLDIEVQPRMLEHEV